MTMNKHRDILCYSVFFTNLRMLYHISIFYKELRTMIRIVTSAFFELIED